MASAAPHVISYAGSDAFPVVPRTDGIATVSFVSAPPTAAGTTIVRFKVKEELRGDAPAGSLAATDAEREAVGVSYSASGDQRVLTASLGKKLTTESLRKATVAAVNKARALKVAALHFVLPAGSEALAATAAADVVTNAALLTNYAFDRYVTTEDKVPTLLSAISISAAEGSGADEAAIKAAVNDSAVLAGCTIFARDIANERADDLHPARMEAVATAIAAETGAKLTVVRGEDLVKEGLHLMYAVGQAARHAPRYIELAYNADPAHPEDVILLVGKGVCFDSGGLNIKGTGFMEDMHMDKGGAAAVLGAALAVHRLGIKRNVIFVAGAVENAIDALAYKPHNIIRSHKGLTVEIGNTDAEGRLVLADALSYAQQRHKPHTVFDFATLTGACVVALGEYAAGVFSNSKALVAAVTNAGSRVAERCWHLPIFQEHREELTGTPFADLKSTGEGRYGGACTAAAFLENFIGHEPSKNARAAAGAAGAAGAAAAAAKKPAWVHFDIAGPGMYSRDRGHMKKGATGFGVAVITEYLRTAPAGPLAADE